MATTSLHINLLKWLIIPLVIINLIAAGLIYWLSWIPVQTAFDQSLADAAWALVPRLNEKTNHVELDLSHQAEQVLRIDHLDAIYFVVRNESFENIGGDLDFPSFSVPKQFNQPLAYDGRMRGDEVRVITLKTNLGEKIVFIGVAETLKKRHHIQAEIFWFLLLLEGFLVLFSILIVSFAVKKGLFPLKEVQANLNALNSEHLSSIEGRYIPVELSPLVDAINSLLHRIETSTKARQDFLANIAHQIRTPLAGFKAHLEWLQEKYKTETETTNSINLMTTALEKIVRNSNQFLALARADPNHFEKKRFEPIQLDKLIEESIQQYVQEAFKKEIDLGFDLEIAIVLGDRFLLRDLIDNLIDNAIRYSPPHSIVTVSCFQNENISVMQVEDSGPGIPKSEQEQIFNRFYRLNHSVDGSGLGLAIVKDIANDHGATIKLNVGHNDIGTVFRVEFPR